MIKIFEEGFKEKDFNNFINSNIIDKYVLNATGRTYLWYTPIDKVGRDNITQIEQVGRMIEAAQDKQLAAEIDRIEEKQRLENITAKIKTISPNQKEQWDTVQEARKQSELQIKMHDDTVVTMGDHVLALKIYHQKLVDSAK